MRFSPEGPLKLDIADDFFGLQSFTGVAVVESKILGL